jgi:hypothetical protein
MSSYFDKRSSFALYDIPYTRVSTKYEEPPKHNSHMASAEEKEKMKHFEVLPLPLHHTLRTTHYAPRTTHHALRTTHYAPRTTHHALRTTHYAPRTTHHAPRTTHHAPRTTHHAPRTTHHAPRTTHHAPLSAATCHRHFSCKISYLMYYFTTTFTKLIFLIFITCE